MVLRSTERRHCRVRGGSSSTMRATVRVNEPGSGRPIKMVRLVWRALHWIANRGDASMPDTPASLLREMVEHIGERPYQAEGLRGAFSCVFCGGTTEEEQYPKHEPHCVWPRVLRITGSLAVRGKVPDPGERMAALIRVEERLAREKAEAAAKK